MPEPKHVKVYVIRVDGIRKRKIALDIKESLEENEDVIADILYYYKLVKGA